MLVATGTAASHRDWVSGATTAPRARNSAVTVTRSTGRDAARVAPTAATTSVSSGDEKSPGRIHRVTRAAATGDTRAAPTVTSSACSTSGDTGRRGADGS